MDVGLSTLTKRFKQVREEFQVKTPKNLFDNTVINRNTRAEKKLQRIEMGKILKNVWGSSQ